MVKIDRSYPAPASLDTESKKTAGKYNLSDVIAQLVHDSGNKCYLCEISDLQDPQVEHLIPHKNGKNHDEMYEWDNLFLSCGHCNKVKNAREYDEGIIDCCKVDPESVMRFRFSKNEVKIETAVKDDGLVDRTVRLLNDVYNKKNTGIRVLECDVRVKKLAEEMNCFYKLLIEYRKCPENKLLLRKIKTFLNRKTAFAAFKRQYIKDNLDDYRYLAEYIN